MTQRTMLLSSNVIVAGDDADADDNVHMKAILAGDDDDDDNDDYDFVNIT